MSGGDVVVDGGGGGGGWWGGGGWGGGGGGDHAVLTVITVNAYSYKLGMHRVQNVVCSCLQLSTVLFCKHCAENVRLGRAGDVAATALRYVVLLVLGTAHSKWAIANAHSSQDAKHQHALANNKVMLRLLHVCGW